VWKNSLLHLLSTEPKDRARILCSVIHKWHCLVAEKLTEENPKRMPHRGYGPDRSPCNFFLFGSMKDRLVDKRYAMPKELFSEMETIIWEIPSEMISGVFLTWQERLGKCLDMGGNYIE
jgi:hypothetical protein